MRHEGARDAQDLVVDEARRTAVAPPSAAIGALVRQLPKQKRETPPAKRVQSKSKGAPVKSRTPCVAVSEACAGPQPKLVDIHSCSSLKTFQSRRHHAADRLAVSLGLSDSERIRKRKLAYQEATVEWHATFREI